MSSSSGTGTKADLQSKKESAASSSRGMEMDMKVSTAAQSRMLNVQPKYIGKNMAKGRFCGGTMPGLDPKKCEASPLPAGSAATTSSKLLSQKDTRIGGEDGDVLVSRPVVLTGEGDEDEQPLYASGSAAMDQWVSSSVESSGSGSERSTSSRSTGTGSSSELATNTRRNSGDNGSRHRRHGSSSAQGREMTMTGMHNVDPVYQQTLARFNLCNDPENETWE